MKLTKKQEKEVMLAYNSYWDSYIKGDVKTIVSLLDEDYNQIGSAESEVFFNKKDAVKFLYETIDQVAGKAEIRNRIIKIEPLEGFILINDLFDIYVLIETEWTFYSKFRASTLMQKKEDGWKFIHQHSSMPDTRTQEGENIAIEKISAENLQLREAVKRRTTELEHKNRELEIETALEKVRTIAMGMREPGDMLDVCKTISLQMESLGINEIRNVQTAIFYEQRGTYMNYEYYAKHKKTFITETTYTNHEIHKEFATKMLKGKGEFFITHIKGKEVKDWIAYQKKTNVFIDKFLDTASSLNYYWFSLGPVALGISTYHPLTEKETNLFQRFLKVFELAYRRYLDIEKAEAQAREAQIETALERVRSRSMAMHKSEELKEVIQVVYEQFVQLNIFIEHAGFIMDYKARDDMNIWLADRHGAGALSQVTIPYFDCAHWNSFNEAKAKGMDFFANLLTFEEKNRFYRDLFKLIPGLPEEAKEYYFGCPGLAISTVLLENVGLYIENFLGISYSDEENNTLMRFGIVFQQTYTRFLDLQKAEAQAMEAQIEASLERVRSRTMAMHDSNELLEAVAVFFQQFKSLGLLPSEARTYFCHINTDTHTAKVWMTHTDGKVMQGSHITPLNRSPSMLKYYEAWKSKEPLNIRNYSGEALTDYMQFLSTLPHVAKDEGYQDIFKDPPERIVMTDANFLQGNIGVMTFKPLSQEALDTLVRFAKVFELTYTRFLDLQKAEAQAREAKIEAALERVRARTMAMHKSDDLTSAVVTVFEELRTLGLKTIRCGVGIFDGKNRKVNVWTSSSSEKSDSVQVSGDEMLEGHTLLDGIYDSWQRQEDYSYVLKGEDLTKYYNVVADSNLPVKAPEVNAANAIQYYHCVMFPAGGLFAFRESEFSAEAIRLMKRFADVFHLTFIRHLDLKNAEAQNKIIQVENERKTQELEEARQLQLSMLPKVLPILPNLDIAVYMQTATEVGGDYYDFQVGKDGTLTVAIGDATGHGMKAGTMVTITKSLFDSLASGENILDTFNNISKVIKGMKFRLLSMCLMMLKIKGDQLFISSAAMPPALIYRRKKKTVEEIFMKGMPLGATNNFPYTLKESYLKKGDTILLMSDGLPELSNANEEMYGYARTKTEFHSVGEKEPEEIVDHLKNSASQWVNGKEPDDDVTFVVIKVK